MRRGLIALLLGLAGAPQLKAQGDVATLISAARTQLDQFNPDSASALLERALAPSLGATTAQRVRAYILYGIARLTAKDIASARQALRRALQLSPTERVDSLEFLEPEFLLREFNSERAAIVIVTVAPADAPTAVLWDDTLPAGASGSLGWGLRSRDGALVPPGRYAVLVTAMDSAGGISQTIERVVVVSRVSADTQALPPPLAPAAFAPETLQIRRGSPAAILLGVGLGAAAAFLPSALGRPELNKGLAGDGTAYVVAGGATVAGLVGFLAGHRVRPLPENALRNAELRRRDALSRVQIAAANAQARESAPVRVRLEGGAP